MTDEPKVILTEFHTCPECGDDILCLVDGATPKSCADHDS